MSKAVGENMIVGLDIGTSKVVAIVGDMNPDGSLDIVGIGSHKSRGLKKGTVDSFSVCWHCWQPYPKYEFSWHCRNPGRRSDESRY